MAGGTAMHAEGEGVLQRTRLPSTPTSREALEVYYSTRGTPSHRRDRPHLTTLDNT